MSSQMWRISARPLLLPLGPGSYLHCGIQHLLNDLQSGPLIEFAVDEKEFCCICLGPENRLMIEYSNNQKCLAQWFHCKCLGMTRDKSPRIHSMRQNSHEVYHTDASNSEEWFCYRCIKLHRGKLAGRPDYFQWPTTSRVSISLRSDQRKPKSSPHR